ncbi:hypothetical protein D1872_302860 [compost metagenome]
MSKPKVNICCCLICITLSRMVYPWESLQKNSFVCMAENSCSHCVCNTRTMPSGSTARHSKYGCSVRKPTGWIRSVVSCLYWIYGQIMLVRQYAAVKGTRLCSDWIERSVIA